MSPSRVVAGGAGGLEFSGRLYGREAAVDRLAVAWKEAAAGARVLVLVSGYSGVGKTAVVRRLQDAVEAGGGLFIAGKQDQVRRGTPYVAIGEALASLADQLTALPPEVRRARAEEIRHAVGRLSGAMLDVAPALSSVLGPGNSVPNLPDLEARYRCAVAFRDFLAAAGTPAHPLALFLDDLQWVDGASVDLFRAVACDEGEIGRGGILIVGAYRENEVGVTHPFARAVSDAAAVGLPIHRIALTGLPRADTRTFLADLLDPGAGAPRPETLQLADTLHAKTAGNPFFLKTLIEHLHDAGALTQVLGVWHWDEAAVRRLSVSDNVADLLSARWHKLAPDTCRTLSAAACLGVSFPVVLLAEATGIPGGDLVDAVNGSLAAAEREGLIDVEDGTASFVHDRVQQSALALAGRDEPALRLQIARRLLQSSPLADLSDRQLFVVATQFLEAAGSLNDEAERRQAARVMQQAGRAAHQSAAFAEAHDFLAAGVALLPADVWQTHPSLALDLYRETMLAAFAATRHDAAEAAFSVLQHQVADPIALVDCVASRLKSLMMQRRYEESRDLAVAFLGRLGFPVNRSALDTEVASLLAEAEAFLAVPGALEGLAERPMATDARLVAAIALSTSAVHAAFFVDKQLFALLALRAFVWASRAGPCAGVPESLVMLNVVLSHLRESYAQAGRLGPTAIAAARRLGDRHSLGWTLHVEALTCSCWYRPLRETLSGTREAETLLLQAGDPQMSSSASLIQTAVMFEMGTPLPEVLAESEIGIAKSHRTGNRHSEISIVTLRQAVRALLGMTKRIDSFDEEGYRDEVLAAEAEPNPMTRALYLTWRLVIAALAGSWKDAVRLAGEAAKVQWSVAGFLMVATFRFYSGIARCRLALESPEAERSLLIDHARLDLAHMRAWASRSPENYGYRAILLAAEVGAATGADDGAANLYDEAILQAGKAGRLHDEAFALELSGRFHRAKGDEARARTHLSAARHAFEAWGARAHVRRLAASD